MKEINEKAVISEYSTIGGDMSGPKEKYVISEDGDVQTMSPRFDADRPHRVISAVLVGEVFEVVKQYPTDNTGSMTPDKIVKEIYGVRNGTITLINSVEGQHTPGRWVKETVTFGDGSFE